MEPRWKSRRQYRRADVPVEMMVWLYNDHSLTARLKGRCGNDFRVEVLKQRYARVQRNEEQALGMKHRQHALLREVYLYCGNYRAVYARSVIPLPTLTGRQKRLASLGDKPLGEFLFACPSMLREDIELAKIHPGDTVYEHAMEYEQDPIDPIWGRRSIFRLADKPLLVAEVFLPGITRV